MKLFDLVGGGQQIASLANHQKTVTTLALNGSKDTLLAGSLDRHVKIYSLTDYSIIHSIKYPAPILSLAVSSDDMNLVVGMTSGLLSIRQRRVKSDDEPVFESKQRASRTYEHLLRSQPVKPQPDDVVVESKRYKKLKDYDKLLRTFQYSRALDAVFTEVGGRVCLFAE